MGKAYNEGQSERHNDHAGKLRWRLIVLAILLLFLLKKPWLSTRRVMESMLTRVAMPQGLTFSNRISAALEVFQVHQPVFVSGVKLRVLGGSGAESAASVGMVPTTSAPICDLLLMNHSFSSSYGQPFVGAYDPPSCAFNRVLLNATVTSRGRQYDRLAMMYFGDIEVWRTSTAEPTFNGIRWEFTKDLSEFLCLWKSSQTLIFDLGNIVDDNLGLTAAFDVVLTATFYYLAEAPPAADAIVPISARRGSSNSSSVFSIPADFASNSVTLPRNINRAVFSVAACGQATEEFWWSNVLQSNVDTFVGDHAPIYGHSPFREIQVYIDGQIAGVSWPFPIIFTGGVVPGLWRPIVGIDTFDLREHEIDVTPWLGLLCNGKAHTFTIKVAGIADAGSTGTLTETVGSSWLVTGKIFLWLDSDTSSITTGRLLSTLTPSPAVSVSESVTGNISGVNETLTYTTDVRRDLFISSVIKTQVGTKLANWSQTLTVTNYGYYYDYGTSQVNRHLTTGVDTSTGSRPYTKTYSYPLICNQTITIYPEGNFSIDGSLSRGLRIAAEGDMVFETDVEAFHTRIGQATFQAPKTKYLGSVLTTSQNGSALYFGGPGRGSSSGSGRTEQTFRFEGLVGEKPRGKEELYFRSVEAVNGTVVRDLERNHGTETKEYRNDTASLGLLYMDGLLSKGRAGPAVA